MLPLNLIFIVHTVGSMLCCTSLNMARTENLRKKKHEIEEKMLFQGSSIALFPGSLIFSMLSGSLGMSLLVLHSSLCLTS